jgi:hypothetical protein
LDKLVIKMKFKKANTIYESIANRDVAIRELQRDRRVLKVTNKVCDKKFKNRYGLTIYTKDMVPKTFQFTHHSELKGSIGRFKIVIFETNENDTAHINGDISKKIFMKITRIGGGVKWNGDYGVIHVHIMWTDAYGNICWGTADEQMRLIYSKKDWLFAGLNALNLLETFDDADGSYSDSEIAALLLLLRIKTEKTKYKQAKLRKIYNHMDFEDDNPYDIDQLRDDM